MTKPDSPLIFLHVPKTGGTTLREVLVRQYSGAEGFRFDAAGANREEFNRLPQPSRDKFELIEGHLYYGVHELLSRRATYITVLRDPVDRVLSLYFWIVGYPAHHLHLRLAGSGLTMKEVMQRPPSREFDNFQVRQLTSSGSATLPIGGVTPELLAEAKRNLESFAVVGLTERFDETLVLLKEAFGWKDLACTRLNVTPGRQQREEIDRSVLDIIREHNRYDMELYRFASELFASRLDRLGDRLSIELAALRLAGEQLARAPRPVAQPPLAGGPWRLSGST